MYKLKRVTKAGSKSARNCSSPSIPVIRFTVTCMYFHWLNIRYSTVQKIAILCYMGPPDRSRCDNLCIQDKECNLHPTEQFMQIGGKSKSRRDRSEKKTIWK